MAIALSSIITERTPRPPSMILFGPAGIGKTTFGARSKDPIFICTERGLPHDVNVPHFLATSFSEALDSVDALLNEDHSYRTVCIDSLWFLEQFIFSHVCREENVDSIEKIGWGKGYTYALNCWQQILSRLDKLRDERGMTVLLIGHSAIRSVSLPGQDPFDAYVLDVNKQAKSALERWSDCVFFVNYRISVVERKEGPRTIKSVSGSGERVLYTQERPAHWGKNRYGLPYELAFSWEALRAVWPAK